MEKNEKFGLLGFNGSGKTSTFKSITNEEFTNEGEINSFGVDVLNNFSVIRNDVGYCPQSNALFDYLTVEEMIYYYKKLKLKKDEIINIEELLFRFGLTKFKKTYTKNLRYIFKAYYIEYVNIAV